MTLEMKQAMSTIRESSEQIHAWHDFQSRLDFYRQQSSILEELEQASETVLKTQWEVRQALKEAMKSLSETRQELQEAKAAHNDAKLRLAQEKQAEIELLRAMLAEKDNGDMHKDG